MVKQAHDLNLITRKHMRRPAITNSVVFALVVAGLNLTASAAPVTFWFGGYIYNVYNPSNQLPIAATVGMPFTGRITYDAAHVADGATNTVPGGSYGNYYMKDLAGFTSVFQLAGHVITNQSAQAGYTGQMQVANNYQNEDALMISTAAGGDLQFDGAPLGNPVAIPPRFAYMDIDLGDETKTALNHPGLPATAPNLEKFSKRREWRWGLSLDDGNPTQVYGVSGIITAISTNEIVFLTQTELSNSAARLSWPKLNTGFTLQVCTNLSSGTWQAATNVVSQTAFENTTTISMTGPSKFYRLKK